MTRAMHRILVIDDDPALRRILTMLFETNGFRVVAADTCELAIRQAQSHRPDVCIVDLGLPDRDGLNFIRQIRTWSPVPIIVLTARMHEAQRLAAFEAGVDDYVIKPVEPRVLMARIQALLRRSKAQSSGEHKILRFGRLQIHTAARSVALDGRTIPLSSNEYDLLLHLAMHAGEVQSRETLFQQLHGREYDGLDRMLDVRISHLRRKLGDEADTSERIKTVWGHGYLFVPDAW